MTELITHKVGEASHRQTTSASYKLQQPHPLLVVHLFHQLQTEILILEVQEKIYSNSRLK